MQGEEVRAELRRKKAASSSDYKRADLTPKTKLNPIDEARAIGSIRRGRINEARAIATAEEEGDQAIADLRSWEAIGPGSVWCEPQRRRDAETIDYNEQLNLRDGSPLSAEQLRTMINVEDSCPIDDPEADTIDYLKEDRTSWAPAPWTTCPILQKMFLESVADHDAERNDQHQEEHHDTDKDADQVYSNESPNEDPISQYSSRQYQSSNENPISQYSSKQYHSSKCISEREQQNAKERAEGYASRAREAGGPWTKKLDEQELCAEVRKDLFDGVDWLAMDDCEDLFDTIPASETQIEKNLEQVAKKIASHRDPEFGANWRKTYPPVPEFGEFTQAAKDLVDLLQANVNDQSSSSSKSSGSKVDDQSSSWTIEKPHD